MPRIPSLLISRLLLITLALPGVIRSEDIDLSNKGAAMESLEPTMKAAVRATAFEREIPDSRTSQQLDSEFTNIENNNSLVLLGTLVPHASSARLSWSPEQTFAGIAAPTPVLVVNGAIPGPTLCLTGAVHGDEINGVEIIRQIMYSLEPSKLTGTVIGVPIVNQLGFRRSSRYLPDRRDLNRYFPGHPKGSSASRIAYSFFNQVISHCDALVDIHTGSFHRTNLPQLRADLEHPGVSEVAHAFGGMVVLHSKGRRGTLRRESVTAGVPAVTMEAGEPHRIQPYAVDDGVKRIRTLLTNLGMTRRPLFWPDVDPVYLKSRWIRVDKGGLLISDVALGDTVEEKDVLGKVVDPITNGANEIVSPYQGQVIGMALNQVVMPGFAAYHIGITATKESAVEPFEPKGDAEGDDPEGDDGSHLALPGNLGEDPEDYVELDTEE